MRSISCALISYVMFYMAMCYKSEKNFSVIKALMMFSSWGMLGTSIAFMVIGS